MKRLTLERCNGIKSGYWSPAKKEELVQRLAEYENTGLYPEEFDEIHEKYNRLRKAVSDETGQPLVPFDRLRELAQADRMLGKETNLKSKNISGTVEEISVNSDGIFFYISSGGGGFYIKSSAALEAQKGAEHE